MELQRDHLMQAISEPACICTSHYQGSSELASNDFADASYEQSDISRRGRTHTAQDPFIAHTWERTKGDILKPIILELPYTFRKRTGDELRLTHPSAVFGQRWGR